MDDKAVDIDARFALAREAVIIRALDVLRARALEQVMGSELEGEDSIEECNDRLADAIAEYSILEVDDSHDNDDLNDVPDDGFLFGVAP